jgi:GT2 family glycosyltransferase
MSDFTAGAGVGIVAIGRNEGERAKACLEGAVALLGDTAGVVYVDSGSTDGSPEFARSLGITVVDLDLSEPFTAARARNAGLAAVPVGLAYVQFLDADCELVDGWLATAVATLAADEGLAGVAGRRRERHPDATVFNKLCDMEWDTPIGEADALGGDAMFRREALDRVGAYDPTMIAGEEPEMCLRMRALGYRLRRLDVEMTIHDAAMTSWRQWWTRNRRAGHAYAETLNRHPPTGAHEVTSNYFYALAMSGAVASVPSAGLMLVTGCVADGNARPTLLRAAVLLALVPVGVGFVCGRVVRRVRRHRIARGDSIIDATTYSRYVLLGKLPQSIGQLQYRRNALRGKRSALIEYKD